MCGRCRRCLNHGILAGSAGRYWLVQAVYKQQCFGLSNLWLVQPVAKNTSQVGWFRRSACRSKLKQDPVHAHWTNRLGWFSRTVGRCISTKLERWLVQPVTLLESTRCDCLRSMKQQLVRLIECVAGAAKKQYRLAGSAGRSTRLESSKIRYTTSRMLGQPVRLVQSDNDWPFDVMNKLERSAGSAG